MSETKATYETNALATRQPLTPKLWEMMRSIAPVIHQARLFGVSNQEQALSIILKGHELGLPPAASFEMIHVVEGKPSLSPRGALAVIMQSGELVGLKIKDEPGRCTVWMKRANGFEYELAYSLDDAKKAGVVKPGSAWDKYQANMLRWRAIGFVEDVLFPDLLAGMKRADEYGAAISADGDVVEGQWNIVPIAESPSNTPAAPSTVALSDLTDRFGAEAVMAASQEVLGQMLPATHEDVLRVAAKLAGE